MKQSIGMMMKARMSMERRTRKKPIIKRKDAGINVEKLRKNAGTKEDGRGDNSGMNEERCGKG